MVYTSCYHAIKSFLLIIHIPSSFVLSQCSPQGILKISGELEVLHLFELLNLSRLRVYMDYFVERALLLYSDFTDGLLTYQKPESYATVIHNDTHKKAFLDSSEVNNHRS